LATYGSDEEQIEAIKAWWRDNGRSVIVGVVLAVAGVAGWQGWQWYVEDRAEAAAAVYSGIQNELPMGDADTIIERAETLRADYSGTTYATLAAFAAARVNIRDGDLAASRDWLQWALENADEDSMRTVARTRLARVLGEQGEHARALELLDGDAPVGWRGLYAEIRGDILADQGDYAGAVASYERALDADERLTERRLVELKLNRVRTQQADGGQVEEE